MILTIAIIISFVTSLTWEADADFLVGDELNQFYVVKDSKITKRDSTGKVMSEYSAPSLGRIDQLDVSNPLKPFIFYPDLGKIVVLNTMMAPIEPQIDLFSFSGQITAVCGSVAQHMWFYDSNSATVTRYGQFMNPVVTSSNLNTWVGGGWQTSKMVERNDRLYLWNGDTRLLILDLFGNYVKEMTLSSCDQVWVTQGGVLSMLNQKITFQPFDIVKGSREIVLALEANDQIALSPKYIARYNGKRVVLVKGALIAR